MNEVAAPVSEREREFGEIIGQWSDTARDYPREATLHQLISEQAARTPESGAVIFEDQSLSYGDLERRSNRLAHHLRARGLRPNQLVALSLERSLDMTIGLLGILKAGGAYVPLDLEYPSSRIAFMLADANAPLLLSMSNLSAQLADFAGERVCLDRDWAQIEKERAQNPEAACGAVRAVLANHPEIAENNYGKS